MSPTAYSNTLNIPTVLTRSEEQINDLFATAESIVQLISQLEDKLRIVIDTNPRPVAGSVGNGIKNSENTPLQTRLASLEASLREIEDQLVGLKSRIDI